MPQQRHYNRNNKNTRKEKKTRQQKIADGEQRIIKDKFHSQRKRPPVQPKTMAQQMYLQYLKTKRCVVATGSAGSGKTYCPAVIAADKLMSGEISKVIVSRPYVATGRSIGATTGDVLPKLYPFVRNVLDTMQERMGKGAFEVALQDGLKGQIEVQALESIRGRSFDEECMFIVSEAQNTDQSLMEAIVTRVGDGCQIIIDGDPSQSDIKGINGLQWWMSFVERHNIPDVGMVRFSKEDCVRSGFVRDILDGLDRDRKDG